MSGGFHYVEGGPFQRPDDIMVDENYAESKNLHVGSTLHLGNGIRGTSARWSNPGKLSQLFAQQRRCRSCIRPRGDGHRHLREGGPAGEHP